MSNSAISPDRIGSPGQASNNSRVTNASASFSSPFGMNEENVEVALLRPDLNKGKFPDNSIKTSKYTLMTFIPINLYEQFSRFSNLYFLLVAIISCIPGATAITPAANTVPLVFVVAVGMIRDAYEDFKRHRADDEANSIKASVLREGKFVEIRSEDIQCGDVVCMGHNEEIRSDCIILSSSHDGGVVYIDTANLDGESSLKTKRARQHVMDFLGSVEKLKAALEEKDSTITFVGGPPNPILTNWKGQMKVGHATPLGIDQFLPRGARVRNTDWVHAVVLYTGVKTKMFLNLKQKPAKSSHLDVKLNHLIAFIFGVNLFLIVLLSAIGARWNDDRQNTAWYLQYYLRERNGIGMFWWLFLGFFVLLSYMIPISLFVTLEINKAVQAVLMYWDNEMADYKNKEWKKCKPKTSSLNEQLAQVRYIFTDKTGTLTENRMVYVGGLAGDVVHDERNNPGGLSNAIELFQPEDVFSPPGSNDHHPVLTYLLQLALCHNVQCFKDEADPDAILYDGQSPDEVALVNAARVNLCELLKRTATSMTVRVQDTTLVFEIIAELDFTPERKMMSIVVKHHGVVFLLTKGADSAMLRRGTASSHNTNVRVKLDSELHSLSTEGLRTLVLGYRIMSAEEVQQFIELFNEAALSMGDRKAELEAAYASVENHFEFVGATAVEDKLQDDVPRTIEFFLDARIIVWMLTGDKRETAVTIAATSGLVKPQSDHVVHIDVSALPDDSPELFEVVTKECDQQMQTAIADCQVHDDVVIVIDGVSLNAAFAVGEGSVFLELGQLCRSAVCCRLTPLQKAEIVRLFQSLTSFTALAIGDGANDVSMIQEGTVGIGIMGLEGSQAELASDYAIPQFRFLKRLMVVHGRNCLYRNALCITYSFYKNMVLTCSFVVYSLYSGCSAASLFDSWLLSMFNSMFLLLPPMFLGMFDKDVSDDLSQDYPSLYPSLDRDSLYFNFYDFGLWTFDMVAHGLIIYFLGHVAMMEDDIALGHSGSMDHYGTLIFSVILFTVDMRAAAIIRTWTSIQALGIFLSTIIVPLFILAYSAIPIFDGETWMVGIAGELLGDDKYYLHTIFAAWGLLVVLNTARQYFIESTFHDPITEALKKEKARIKRV